MSSETQDIKREVKKYITVFVTLLVLTVITVATSNLPIGVTFGVILALIIASVKGYLVACNFMHLSSEKKVIYFVLILTAIFVVAMMLLSFASFFNLSGRSVPCLLGPFM